MRRKFMKLIFAVIFILASCPVYGDTLPAKYDLRDYNRVTPVRDQKSYQSCWAFASVSSLESTYKTLYPNENIDFSEMFVAYYLHKELYDKNISDKDTAFDILSWGGNSDRAAALIAKYGIVNESVIPYPALPDKNKSIEELDTAGIRLKAAYLLYVNGKIDEHVKITIKNFIKNYGAVHLNYYDNKSFSGDGNSAYYNGVAGSYNHAVSAVGWDDNFPREIFPENKRPEKDGAWLIKNSWGTNWHNQGYFWMSYEQPVLDSAVLIADKAPQDIKRYDYDTGMRTRDTACKENIKWSSAIFKAEADETLKYIGFCTVKENTNYNIYVYDLGGELTSSPVNGILIATLKGFKEYRGYHTEDFSESIALLKDHYFSVVINCDTGTTGDNGYNLGDKENYSFCSENATDWVKFRTKITGNACIKAFTVPGITASQLALTGTLHEAKSLESYSASLKASGEIKPFKWTVNNDLPEDMNYHITGDSDSEIKFSGTPLKSGTHTINITLEDRQGAKISKSFTLKVNALDINLSGSFAEYIVKGNSYSGNITLNGGKAPYEWQLSEGSLPQWLKLSYDNNKAVLSGTPNLSGTYNFALKVSDSTGGEASNKFTIRVYDKPVINGSFANSLVKGADYSQTLSITGGYSDSFKLSKSGTMPPGLSLVMSGRKLTLSGKVSRAGTYKFTVNITDNSGITASKAFTVKVTEMTITGALNNGATGTAYNCKITVSGGSTPYKWTYSGTLPNGLKLTSSGANAILSGVPTKAGKFTFKITAYDKNNADVTKSYTVNIESRPAFNGSFASVGSTGKKYSSTVKITGGASPYKYKASGKIPKGLKLTYSGANIKLSGTPTKAGTNKFTLQVTDKNKNVINKSFSVKIFKLSITGNLKAGTVKKSYTGTVRVKGGTAPYKCKKSGTLPKGLKLSFSGTKAKLSGKPTKSGKYLFTLKFTDKNKFTVSKKFTVQINEAQTAKTSIRQAALKAANTVSSAKISESSGISANTAVIAAPYAVQHADNNFGHSQAVHVIQVEKITLDVNEESIISRGTDRDEDLITVKAGEAITFEVTELRVKDAKIIVFYDFKEYEDISVNDENKFTLPAELVKGDFVVNVRAEANNYEAESDELYFEAEE